MKLCKIVMALLGTAIVSMSISGALAASRQDIVGAWSIGDTTFEDSSVIVLDGNGGYYQIQNSLASDTTNFDGFERGTYTWDPVTGAFSVDTIQDTNGAAGLNSLSGVTVTVSGNNLIASISGSGSISAARVTAPSPIVGAWGLGNPAVADSSAVVVFLPNNTYFMAQDGDPTAPGESCGKDGIEHGTYSWNPNTGAFTSSRSPSPYVDTNGCWGLSDVSGSGTVAVSPDRLTLTFTEGAESNAVPRIAPAGSTVTPPNTIVEFYHAGFRHYFISINPDEIRDLDSGAHGGWVRTGQTFNASASPTAGASPVCRFYIPPGYGDSHFFSASPQECSETNAKFPQLTYESPSAFYIGLPDSGTGACPMATMPVYRVWNNRSDSNHRYTTSSVIREQMVSRGGIAEGYGPDAVIMCAPQ
jgi:hypothetical protein